MSEERLGVASRDEDVARPQPEVTRAAKPSGHDDLSKLIADAIADAFARGEALGRFMAEHEARLRRVLGAVAKIEGPSQ